MNKLENHQPDSGKLESQLPSGQVANLELQGRLDKLEKQSHAAQWTNIELMTRLNKLECRSDFGQEMNIEMIGRIDKLNSCMKSFNEQFGAIERQLSAILQGKF